MADRSDSCGTSPGSLAGRAAPRINFAIGVILVASVLGTALLLLSRVRAQPAVVRRAIDLGVGRPGQILTAAFDVANPSSHAVGFSIIRNCSCSSLTIDPQMGQLQPHSSQKFQIRFHFESARREQKTMSFALKLDDPSLPTQLCSINAECRLGIEIVPNSLDFGCVARDGLAGTERILTIQSDEPGRQPDGTSSENLGLTPSSSALEVTAVSPNQLRVSLSEAVADGDTYGSINIYSPSLHTTFVVPVHVFVSPDVYVVPRKIILSTGHDPTAKQSHTIMAIASSRQMLGPLETVSAPRGVTVHEIASSHPYRRYLQVQLTEDIKHRVEISLRFRGVKQDCSVELVPHNQ